MESSRSHYAAVYADLKLELDSLEREAQKIRLEQERLKNALSFIRARMSGSATEEETEGKYAGLELVASAVQYLRVVGHFSQTRAIADALIEGGYRTTARNFYNNVYGSLNREADKKTRRVVKSGPKWGLPEWEEEEAEDQQSVLDQQAK